MICMSSKRQMFSTNKCIFHVYLLYDFIFDLIKNVNLPTLFVFSSQSELLSLPVRCYCVKQTCMVKKCSKLSFINVY